MNKKLIILVSSVFMVCIVFCNIVYSESNTLAELKVFSDNKEYYYVNGVPQNENDLENDFDLLVDYDENTVTYSLNIIGNVTLNENDDYNRGIIITDGNLKVFGNGTLTIIIDGVNPATVFETKKREFGYMEIGSENPSDRLKINVICESDYSEANPHSFRVFRPYWALFQNIDIKLVGAGQFMEAKPPEGKDTIFRNCHINDIKTLTSFGADDNILAFIDYTDHLYFYDSDISITSSNSDDFIPSKYDESQSYIFSAPYITINNSNFVVNLPIYHFAREVSSILFENNSSINISTYAASFFQKEKPCTSVTLNNSSLRVNSTSDYCFSGDMNISFNISADNTLDLTAPNEKSIFHFKNSVNNPNLNIIHPDIEISTAKPATPSDIHNEEINWDYDYINSTYVFNRLFTGNHKVYLRYSGNGGTPLLQNSIIDKDMPASSLNPPINVTRNGYTFLNWGMYDENGILNGPISDDSNIVVDSVVYAMWQCNHDEYDYYDLKCASATDPGHLAYYKCKVCGEYYFVDVDDHLVEINDINDWTSPEGDGYIEFYNNDENQCVFDGPELIDTKSITDDDIFLSSLTYKSFCYLLLGNEDNISNARLVSKNNYDFFAKEWAPQLLSTSLNSHSDSKRIGIKLHDDYLKSLKSGTYYLYIVSNSDYAKGSFTLVNKIDNNKKKYTIPNTGVFVECK